MVTRHAEMLDQLAGLCQDRELLFWIAPDARRGRGCAGFPDALAAGANGAFFIEAKTRLDEPAPEQDLWAWAIQINGGRYFVWHDTPESTRVLTEWLDGLGRVPAAKLLYR